jgi:signal transduction histidine kinase/streptogramin lyase
MFGGVDRFDRQNGSWRHYRYNPDDPGSLSNNFVSAIYKDRSGVLWVGTASGLDRFNPETETFTHYQAEPDGPPGSLSNNVRTIYEGGEGEFWIGTKGGLYRFDREKESWSHHYRHDPDDPHSLSNDWVFSFKEDREGRIWIGTLGGGLNRFDPEKEIFARYQNVPGDPHSLSNNLVMSVFQDREGALWLATAGGLDRLVLPEEHRDDVSEAEGFDQGTETFTHYREKDGLSNDSVYCVLEDTQGHLWVSTNKGLSRFDPQRETFRNYDVTDGLQSNEFNGNACLMSHSEEVFFGGINGFNAFFPDHVNDNPTIPPVVLTSLVQGGEEVNLGIAVDSVTEVIFKWPDNSFEFEFAALSFAQPEKNQYAYYLEGFEETWNEVGTRRYGQYTNLPGGAYTLRVKGSNNDGVWNEVGTAVKITVVPPFWATWWFRGVVLLAVLGAIFGGYRLRVRNLEARSRELESQVEQRTAELMETQDALRQIELEKAITEERSRLARELHDSVTQSLHSSTLLAEAGQRLVSSGDIERARGYLIRLGEISQQALKEMRLLVYELRPLALSGVGLVRALQQRLDAVERRSGVEVQLSIEEELELPASIEEELFRIAMEALNNALKHANPTRVTVALSLEKKRAIPCIELAIIDDCIGFDPDTKEGEGGCAG